MEQISKEVFMQMIGGRAFEASKLPDLVDCVEFTEDFEFCSITLRNGRKVAAKNNPEAGQFTLVSASGSEDQQVIFAETGLSELEQIKVSLEVFDCIEVELAERL